MECDYRYELQSQQRFKQLIAGDPTTSQVGWLGYGGVPKIKRLPMRLLWHVALRPVF